LRERREDIPPLVDYFARQVSAQNSWKSIPFTPDALELLQSHPWPGNVRELRNVVERLLLLATEGNVNAATVRLALPATSSGSSVPSSTSTGTLAERVDSFERETILAELKRQGGHVTNTAKSLGLERSHLYKKAHHLKVDLAGLKGSDS
jgi:two-component system nitrogen regulation response regulator NtrX